MTRDLSPTESLSGIEARSRCRMDEILDAVDLLADLGLEGLFTWLLRLLGLVVLLVGVGLWLFTDVGLLLVPALVMLVGLALLVAPEVLLLLAELAG